MSANYVPLPPSPSPNPCGDLPYRPSTSGFECLPPDVPLAVTGTPDLTPLLILGLLLLAGGLLLTWKRLGRNRNECDEASSD